jgi:integrase
MSVFMRKGSPYFQYEFYYAGEPYRGSTKKRDKRDAQTHERRVRKEVIDGARRNMAGHSVADIFAKYYAAHGKKLKWAPTLEKHMDGLEAYFGATKRFADITTKDVASCLDDYAATTERKNRDGTVRPGTPSDSTVNRRLAVFRQIYMVVRDTWELPVGHVNFKKLARKEPKERVRHIEVMQAKILLDRLDDDFEIMLMAAWSLATGCRLNETETLRWTLVNYETMQAEVNTKGGGTRFVDLSPDAVAILAMCNRNRVYVFDATNRRKIWEAAVLAAGLDNFRWHDMRHCFATWLGNKVGDIAIVMKALGHTKIETTMKYRHVIRADVKAGVAQLPTLIEGKVLPLKRPDGKNAEA